jgi:hypothetical protein
MNDIKYIKISTKRTRNFGRQSELTEGLYFVTFVTGLIWPKTGKDNEDYDIQILCWTLFIVWAPFNIYSVLETVFETLSVLIHLRQWQMSNIIFI